jgi:uncharacterized coiled-coil protein SlyX
MNVLKELRLEARIRELEAKQSEFRLIRDLNDNLTSHRDELMQQLAKVTMERDEAVAAVQRLAEGMPFDAVVIADGIRRGVKQQLAEREKQNVMLRDVIEQLLDDMGEGHCVCPAAKTWAKEALAATADLAGLVVCDAEPVGKYTGTEHEYGYQIVQLDCDIEVGTKLYKAKEKS